MVNFGLLTAEICWRVWGTPANFNGFRVLACSVTARHSSSGRRAGFSLSRALFRKNMGPYLIYVYRPTEFTCHTKSFSYYYFNYFWHVVKLQKFAGPLVGALFCGAPVRPNMLNMPKSASEWASTKLWR